MSKTAKVEARVLPARLERYRKAAAVLKLDETSDFVRRACDELADRTLPVTKSGSSSGKPAPAKAKTAAAKGHKAGRVELSDGRRVRA